MHTHYIKLRNIHILHLYAPSKIVEVRFFQTTGTQKSRISSDKSGMQMENWRQKSLLRNQYNTSEHNGWK